MEIDILRDEEIILNTDEDGVRDFIWDNFDEDDVKEYINECYSQIEVPLVGLVEPGEVSLRMMSNMDYSYVKDGLIDMMMEDAHYELERGYEYLFKNWSFVVHEEEENEND